MLPSARSLSAQQPRGSKKKKKKETWFNLFHKSCWHAAKITTEVFEERLKRRRERFSRWTSKFGWRWRAGAGLNVRIHAVSLTYVDLCALQPAAEQSQNQLTTRRRGGTPQRGTVWKKKWTALHRVPPLLPLKASSTIFCPRSMSNP